jgi:hypothetical protein
MDDDSIQTYSWKICRKTLLRRYRHRWENNIKITISAIIGNDEDWIHCGLECGGTGAFVNMVMNLRALENICSLLTRSATGFFKKVYDPRSLILLTLSLFAESTLQIILLDSMTNDETEIRFIATMTKSEMCAKFRSENWNRQQHSGNPHV